MINNLLLSELHLLQKRYRAVLVNAKDGINKANITAIINEILSFWYQNRKLVECTLKYLSKPFESYLFTAATNLDLADGDHLPFILIGNAHILNDPIYEFAKTVDIGLSQSIMIRKKELALEAIDDNIKIIDGKAGAIFILPVTFLLSDADNASKIATLAFLNMFKEKMTVDDYFRKFENFRQIENALVKGADSIICFSDIGETSVPLQERFADFKNDKTRPFADEESEARLFFCHMIAHLMQAADTLTICLQYELTPYFRYPVAFHYLMWFSNAFYEIADNKKMAFNAQTAFVLQKIIDRDMLLQIDILRYISKADEFNFDKMFLTAYNDASTERKSIPQTVDSILNSFYKTL